MGLEKSQATRRIIWVWVPDPDKGFTVRGAYDWWSRALPLVPAIHGKARALWKLKVPLKVKVFLWLALQDRLLTKARRARWRPQESELCVLCNEDRETTFHILCECKFSRSLWARILMAVGRNFTFNSLDDMWDVGQQLCNTAGGGTRQLVAEAVVPAMTWVIWRTRNGVIFRGHTAYVENA
ncbi:putative ribonuclease H protein [Acorus calamus]|uniref:Ribonuclease H protein n=1 Tax=Acorus calamus TaxID=4465 RepID=A0AAV9F6F8_ACOCL|nr:putative ribonuclease H protein [Acorus calamus]